MATDNTSEKFTPAPDLRRRAEDRLDAALSKTAGISRTDYDAARLLHEVEVHRIELEMQNEELRRAKDEAESNLLKYSDLYELAPVGYFTLDRSGQINLINLRGAILVGVTRSRLLGRSFALLVMDAHRQLFTDFLNKVFSSREKSSCEVTLKNRDNNTPIVVLLEGMAAVSGEECVLVLIDISGRKRIEGELRSFASRIVIMEEEFRKKIAVELHNDICSDLTLLGMNVASIVDGIKEIAPPETHHKSNRFRETHQRDKPCRQKHHEWSPPAGTGRVWSACRLALARRTVFKTLRDCCLHFDRRAISTTCTGTGNDSFSHITRGADEYLKTCEQP